MNTLADGVTALPDEKLKATLDRLCPDSLPSGRWDFTTVSGLREFATACYGSGYLQAALDNMKNPPTK